jgi:hypothetical protein
LIKRIAVFIVLITLTLWITPAPAQAGDQEDVVTLVNNLRASLGRACLTIHPQLTAAAQVHSQYMFDTNELTHEGPGGSSVSQRVAAHGYTPTAAGENVAYGYTSAQAVFDGWAASQSHYNNMVSTNYHEIGVARVGSYWTMVLARRSGLTPAACAQTSALISPAGSVTNHTGSPTFTWADVPGATHYWIYVASSAGAQIINEVVADVVCNGTTCTYDFTTLREQYRLAKGSYIWYVRPYFASGPGGWSSGLNFTINADPPGLPTLGGTTNINTLRPTFNWTLTGNATRATWLRVVVAGGGTTALDRWVARDQVCGSMSGTTCAFVSPVDLVDGRAYQLYVQSYGPGGLSTGGTSGFAGPGNFTVDAPTPALPQISAAAWDRGRVRVDWTDDASARWFEVVIVGPTGTVHQQWYERTAALCSSSCRVEPILELRPGAYNAYVRAWGPGGFSMGGINGYSQPFSFQVWSAPPWVQDSMLLINMWYTDRPQYSWSPYDNASWYNFVVFKDNQLVFNQWYHATQVCTEQGPCIVRPAFNLPNGSYDLYFRAYGPGGFNWSPNDNGGYGPPIDLDINLLPAEQVTTPITTGVITNKSSLVSWTARASNTYYRLYLVNAASGAALYDRWHYGGDICVTGTCRVDVGFTFPNGAYAFYVQGYSPAGIGPLSAAFNFTVAVPAAPTPTLQSPAADAVIYTTNRPTLGWSAGGSTEWTYVEVKNGLGTVVFSQWVQAGVGPCAGGTCQLQIANPITYGGYTWRAQSWSQGGFSAFTPARNFLVLSINTTPMVVQADDDLVSGGELWTAQADSSAVGGMYLTSQSGGAPVDTALTLTFTGTAVDVVYLAGPLYGTFVIEIDGVPTRAVDASAAQVAYGQIASVSGLSAGTHTLRIVPLGGSPVAIDAIAVDGQALLTPETATPVVTATPIPVTAIPVEPTATMEPIIPLTPVPVEPTAPTATPIPEVTAESTPEAAGS